MKRLMNLLAGLCFVLGLQAQKGHLALAGDRTYRMRQDAWKDSKIKRNERKYTETLAHKASKRAKGSLDVVIVLKREKKNKDGKQNKSKVRQ